MKKILSGFMFTVGLPMFLMNAVLGDEMLVLAENGTGKASIVTADNAPAKIRIAANDLQKTVKESTGALLPIIEESKWQSGPRILVGESGGVKTLGIKVSQGYGVNLEEVIMRRVGGDIVLLGNDSGGFCGTQDAVVEFLKKITGADFYQAAPGGKVVPRHEKLEVGDLDVKIKPAFSMRPAFQFDLGQSKSNEAIINEYRRWNHCKGVRIDHRHSHFLIAPPEKYFKAHPEYYSEVNGKRLAKGNHGWQLCTTNPDVIGLAVKFCRGWLDKNPDTLAAPLSFNDCNDYCMCAECRKLDRPDAESGISRRLCVFANAVACEIAKSHPGKGVSFYAYYDTVYAPLDIKLEPNVTPTYAYSDGCAMHALNDQSCPLNRETLERMKRWRDVAQNLKVYGYAEFLCDYNGLPTCNLHKAVEDARTLKELNATGLYLDLAKNPGMEPNYWAIAQVMWQGDWTAESLRKKFCDGMFGNASLAMQDYYRVLEERITGSGVHAPEYSWIMPGPLYVWNDDMIRDLRNILFRASVLVPVDSAEADRINGQFMLIDFTDAFVHLKRVQRDFWRNESEANLAAYKEWRKKYLDLHEKLKTRGLLNITNYLNAYAPETPHVSWEKPPEIKLVRATERPGMDPLAINDIVWSACHVKECFWDEDVFPAYPVTTAYMIYDDTSLYVRINCHDQNMPKIRADEKNFDGDVWRDDCVRFSVAIPAGSQGDSVKKTLAWERYDFLANAAGVKRDVKNGNSEWNGDWKVIASKSDRLNSRQWAVIIEIPWKTLGLTKAPAKLRANMFRNVTTPTVQPVQYLSSTLGSMDNVDRYARILFGE